MQLYGWDRVVCGRSASFSAQKRDQCLRDLQDTARARRSPRAHPVVAGSSRLSCDCLRARRVSLVRQRRLIFLFLVHSRILYAVGWGSEDI